MHRPRLLSAKGNLFLLRQMVLCLCLPWLSLVCFLYEVAFTERTIRSHSKSRVHCSTAFRTNLSNHFWLTCSKTFSATRGYVLHAFAGFHGTMFSAQICRLHLRPFIYAGSSSYKKRLAYKGCISDLSYTRGLVHIKSALHIKSFTLQRLGARPLYGLWGG